MRVELARSLQHRCLGHDAQLTQPEVQAGPRQRAAIAFSDHPGIHCRMQGVNAVPELPVVLSVHYSAQLLPAPSPLGGARIVLIGIRVWGLERAHLTPDCERDE